MMATAEEIAALRLMIAEPDNVAPYTDLALGSAIDAADGDLNAVACQIWTTKAAGVVGLVDISEGGSSRKMGDLHEQYLTMAKTYCGRTVAATAEASRTTRISKIRR
jgi:hypothetical protein